MIRYFSLSLLLGMSSLCAMETAPEKSISFSELAKTLQLPSQSVRADGLREKVDLFYDQEGFFVRNGKEDVRVKYHDTDKVFHKRKLAEIARYAASESQFKVSKFDNGEYTISATDKLKGGGPCLAIAAAIGVRLIGYSISLPFLLFVPGGGAVWLYGCAMTENAATVATAAAMAAPTG